MRRDDLSGLNSYTHFSWWC